MFEVFFIDAILTAIAAWLVVRATGHGTQRVLEAGLAWSLAFVALVAGAGVVLGEIGALGARGFCAFHAGVLGLLLVWRRRDLAGDRKALGTCGGQIWDLFSGGKCDWRLGVGVLVPLGVLLVLAAWAEPVVYDGLTYRLPRIGDWLQSGRIRMLATDDPRLNYMPVVPDLVMAWLLTGARTGYHLMLVAQAIGGGMTFGATLGLARQTGLGRNAAVMAGALLLGMANVVPQFTSSHTDLFTTGVFATTFYLWNCMLQRGQGSMLGGVGAGLALGAKGTCFYLAPGALVWVAWLAWQHPLPWRRWRQTVFAASLSVVFFAGLIFLRNWKVYGGIFGPQDYVRMHHRGASSAGDFVRKLGWNLTSSFVQLFDPNSQPAGLRAAARQIGFALSVRLPTQDEYAFESLNRQTTLQQILRRDRPDADVTSFGLLPFVVFLMGAGIAAAKWREPAARLVLVWSGGVVVFLVFFHAMQQWHPYGYRYFVLAAPWMAVVTAWGIEQLGGYLRLAVWTVVLLCAANVGWFVTIYTHQVGWQAIVQPARSRGYFVFQNWSEWALGLGSDTRPLLVALPPNLPLAAFFRQAAPRETVLRHEPAAAVMSAEELVKGETGWVVVNAGRFLGREGRVMASTWLFEGDESSLYSLAAYRRLLPGEHPVPVVYRSRRRTDKEGIWHELLLKSWGDEPIQIQLTNPSLEGFSYRLQTPLGGKKGELPPGAKLVLAVPVAPDSVSEVRLLFDQADGGRAATNVPGWELVR